MNRPLTDQETRDLRHAERDAQISSIEARLANDPVARAKLERLARHLQLAESRRLNAEANHDYIEGFEERWADEHSSLKRGP